MVRATLWALPAAAAAAAVLFSCLPSAASAAVTLIHYTDNGNFQAPSYAEGGVVVTASGTLNITDSFGLGVVGGDHENEVDPAGAGPDEYLHFTAAGDALFHHFALPASGSGGSWGLSNVDGGSIDSFTLEGFSAQGASVGTFNYAGSGVRIWEDEFVSRLGAGPLDAVRLTASGDRFWLGAITIAIPEPHGPGSVCIAAAAMARRGRRRAVRG